MTDDLPTAAEWASHRAFHKLTVSQRDAAWRESAQRLACIKELQRWKTEGLEVLDEWEQVYEAAGRPGPLGLTKASCVRARIEELEAGLKAARHHDLCRCAGCQRINEVLDD